MTSCAGHFRGTFVRPSTSRTPCQCRKSAEYMLNIHICINLTLLIDDFIFCVARCSTPIHTSMQCNVNIRINTCRVAFRVEKMCFCGISHTPGCGYFPGTGEGQVRTLTCHHHLKKLRYPVTTRVECPGRSGNTLYTLPNVPDSG